MLLRLEFVDNKVLEGFRIKWCSELSVSDFLPTVKTRSLALILSNPWK
jgi:hypothetical protein